MYAVGVVLWEIATLQTPYNHKYTLSQLIKLKQTEIDTKTESVLSSQLQSITPPVPPEYIDLVKRCLSPVPSERITANDLVNKIEQINSLNIINSISSRNNNNASTSSTNNSSFNNNTDNDNKTDNSLINYLKADTDPNTSLLEWKKMNLLHVHISCLISEIVDNLNSIPSIFSSVDDIKSLSSLKFQKSNHSELFAGLIKDYSKTELKYCIEHVSASNRYSDLEFAVFISRRYKHSLDGVAERSIFIVIKDINYIQEATAEALFAPTTGAGADFSKFEKGLIHARYSSLAARFPLEAFLDLIIFGMNSKSTELYNPTLATHQARDRVRLIFTGHGIGGAIAECITLRAINDLEDKRQYDQLKNITFGSPLIGDTDLNNSIQHEVKQVDNIFTHFVNDKDDFPRIITYLDSIGYYTQLAQLQAANIPKEFTALVAAMNKLSELLYSHKVNDSDFSSAYKKIAGEFVKMQDTVANITSKLQPSFANQQEFIMDVIGIIFQSTANKNYSLYCYLTFVQQILI